ncbi:MAG: MFS transporter [Gammaproteobacteria bacterium]|nr:MFS transporter [Gammaproteobacteria bacterium]
MKDSGAATVEITTLIDDRPLGGLQILVLVLCAVIVLFDGYDIQTMALVIPTLSAAWGIDAGKFNIAVTAAIFGMGAGAALLAHIGDRIGRRPALMLSLLLLGVSCILTAYAQSVNELILWRFMTGVALGVCLPNATALTSDYMPSRSRATLVTLMFCNVALGSFIAGNVAPLLLQRFGWQSVFIVGGVAPIVLAVLVFFIVPESCQFLLERRPGDPRLARLLARLAPGIDPATVRGAARDRVPRQSPLMLLSPSYRTGTLLLWVVFCLNLYVLYFLISWLPTLLSNVGWPRATALRASVSMQFGGIIGGLLLSYLVDRGKVVLSMGTAYAGAAIVFALFMVVPAEATSWIPLLVLMGAGISGGQATLYALAATYYPAMLRATGLGWAAVIGRLGAVTGPLSGGWAVQAKLGTDAVLGLMLIPTVLCALSVALLPWALRKR